MRLCACFECASVFVYVRLCVIMIERGCVYCGFCVFVFLCMLFVFELVSVCLWMRVCMCVFVCVVRVYMWLCLYACPRL